MNGAASAVARVGALLAASAGLAGCLGPTVAAQPGVVFQSSKDPAEYRSPQPRDARALRPAPAVGTEPVAASGTACRTMLAFPSSPPAIFYGSNTALSLLPWNSWTITEGDDRYATAVSRALDSAGAGDAVLYDVRTDVHTIAVLGIWRRECLEVHGLVAR